MSQDQVKLGRRGELLAAAHLEAEGWAIAGRNIRTPAGEIDLLARDGSVWVFVEVRTRRGQIYGTPEESISVNKRRHMLAAALHYLTSHGLEDADWRIDAVAVELSTRGELRRIEVIHNAIEG